MPTLTDYRREILRVGPEDLGEFHDIDSLTTTTVVVNDLATGFFSDQKLHGYYILRPDAGSPPADRIRTITAFNSSNGTLTHEGTNYADTTATDEVAEIWKHDPRMVDEAINTTLKRMRRMYGVEIPVHGSVRRYWLNDLDWVEEPADVERIDWFNSPQLSRNRYFDLYNSYDTGKLLPDFWELTDDDTETGRSTDQTWRNKYTFRLKSDGQTSATMNQNVGLLETGVDDDTLRGEKVTAVLVGYSNSVESLRVQVRDGDTTSNSDYHTGVPGFEELSVEHTVSDDATKLEVVARSEKSATDYIGECYLIKGELTDTVRRDSYERYHVYHKGYEQTSSLPVFLEPRGTGGYYLVTTQRSYPQLTGSRIRGGIADDDVSDAPLEIVATGAIGRLYERLSQVENERTQRERGIAVQWNKRFEQMAKRHLYRWNTEHGAAPTFGRTWAAPAATRRF